jgi:hypothetical protein
MPINAVVLARHRSSDAGAVRNIARARSARQNGKSRSRHLPHVAANKDGAVHRARGGARDGLDLRSSTARIAASPSSATPAESVASFRPQAATTCGNCMGLSKTAVEPKANPISVYQRRQQIVRIFRLGSAGGARIPAFVRDHCGGDDAQVDRDHVGGWRGGGAEAAKAANEEKANNINAQLNGGLVADSVGLVTLFLVLSLLAASAILAALVDLLR